MLDLYKSSRITSRKSQTEGEASLSFIDNSVNKWIKMSLERIDNSSTANHSIEDISSVE